MGNNQVIYQKNSEIPTFNAFLNKDRVSFCNLASIADFTEWNYLNMNDICPLIPLIKEWKLNKLSVNKLYFNQMRGSIPLFSTKLVKYISPSFSH